MTDSGPPELTSLEQFMFEASLYAKFTLPRGSHLFEQLYNRAGSARFDGYCPDCKRLSTFSVSGTHIPGGDPWNSIYSRYAFDHLTATCARSDAHKLRFWFRIRNGVIEKLGQYPSLADIANDEVRPLRGLLSKTDAAEFHRAVGLAAHGIGVGSFVYLRRIFERLIATRFSAHQAERGWEVDDFQKLRMAEKVAFLADYLPPFLVANAKIYSIVSVGIHSLSEEQCLGFFSILKQSIIIILEEDARRAHDLKIRQDFSAAISGFDPDALSPVSD